MAGGVFSAAKLNGMTIRESANDGSDFTNPDADYRKLFLGEDGYLHVKDSSGTVSDPYNTTPAAGLATARAVRTSADLTLNNTSWTNVDTGLDLTVAAAAGDVLEVSLSGVWGSQAVVGVLDAATIVSGSPVNYVSGGAGGAAHQGVTGWRGTDAVITSSVGSSVQYVVQAGDISGGNVVLRLRYRTVSASNKTLYSSANIPLHWSVKNLG